MLVCVACFRVVKYAFAVWETLICVFFVASHVVPCCCCFRRSPERGEEGRRAFWRKRFFVGIPLGVIRLMLSRSLQLDRALELFFLEGLAVLPLSRRPFFDNVVVALVVSCFAAHSKEGQPLPARDVYCSASD